MADDVKPTQEVPEGGSFFDEFMGSSNSSAEDGGLDFGAAEQAISKAGQQSDSPPDTDDGQESDSQTGTGDKDAGSDNSDTDKGASESGKPPTDKKEGEDKEDAKKEKALPYDQDPKWKAARAAEKRLEDILEKHQLTDPEDIENALADRDSLKALIGEKDAKQLLKDSQELAKIKQFWADQEAKERESEETPEETIARQKREIESLHRQYENKEADRRAVDEANKAVQHFNSTVSDLVDGTEGLTDADKDVLSVWLGVDNPIDEVDISDSRAVKSTAAQGIEAFKEYIADIKQKAIDDYVAGQSDIKPVPKTSAATESTAVRKKGIPANVSDEEAFAIANKQLEEILLKARAE